jgi:target of rapamycin complex subunit LST8
MVQNGDFTTLIPVTSYQAHSTYITRVLLSPDVRHLATCSADHNARIWGISEAQLAAASAANNAAEPPATGEQTFRAQHMHTAAGGMPNIANSNPNNPNNKGALPLEANLGLHQRWVWDCAFSADSAYLVTASSDHNARLWELSTQSIIRQYHGHHRGAVCVALNDYSETR